MKVGYYTSCIHKHVFDSSVKGSLQADLTKFFASISKINKSVSLLENFFHRLVSCADYLKWLTCEFKMQCFLYLQLAKENAKDIISCGFDINKTFMFTDFNYIG